jgi:hypothetical protein
MRYFVLLLLLVSACTSFDPGAMLKKATSLPSIESMLNKPPITTSFDDAHAEVTFLDGTIPENAIGFPIEQMPRDAQGRYLLGPGFYELDARSYCIRAGTYGPAKGDGHIYAPLLGPKTKVVQAILRRSAQKPDVPQHDVQLLLWAVLARAKLRDMSPHLQQTATALLEPRELFDLNGGALGLIPPEMLEKYLAKVSPQLQKIYRAEQQIRQHLARATATYQEIERLAVLAGLAPPEDEIRPTPRGRWSWHPDGYFIRYFPQGYQRTRMQVYIPPTLTIERDERGRITSLSDGGRFRFETRYSSATATTPDGLEAQLFTEVRLSAREQTIVRKGKGWTFYTPAVPADSVTAKLPAGSAARQTRTASLRKLLAGMTLTSETSLPLRVSANVADVEGWANAVRIELARPGFKKGETAWAPDALSLLLHAPASALRSELGAKQGLVPFDPTKNVAVPANTSGQRLASGGSPVPGERWFQALPDCWCSWSQIPKTEPDKHGRPGRWSETKGGNLDRYHPGAAREVRWTPNGGGHGQQCTYVNGRLITGGLAAGTPDFYSPGGGQVFLHLGDDVVPFGDWWWRLFLFLNGVDSITCDIFFSLNPPNNGKGCDANPVGPEPSTEVACGAMDY